MPEEIPTPKPIEASRTAEEIEKEENERYEVWMTEHPVIEIPQDAPEAVAEKVAECEAMMNSFEQTHNLDVLRAITQFSSKEERERSPRQPALEALTPIFKRLKYLSSQGALQSETRESLRTRYETLSQAVGNIVGDSNGKIFDIVIHDRPTPFPS